MKKIGMFVGCSLLTLSCYDGNVNHNEELKENAENNKYSSLIPGRILVDAKDDISSDDLKDLSKIAGTNLHSSNKFGDKLKFEVGNVDPSKEDDILRKLNQDPRVEHAEPMAVYKALYVPNDTMYKEQWGLKRSGLESSYGMSCGMGVKVAVVDTGIKCDLSDLQGTKCGGGYNFISNTDDATDDQMHGSHVAGTIAQTTNNKFGAAGLASCVNLMPVKVLDENGSGSMESVAEGIRYAADEGASVINLSLGSDFPSDIVKDAVDYAHNKGVVVVAAAGNSGGNVGYPAAYPNAIAVSATTSSDDIANFSCRGPQIAIGAPGVDILQQTINEDNIRDSKGKFVKLSGTSMATPHVAAAAALVVSSGVNKPDDVKAKLQSSADKMDDEELFGAGILRADSAVRSTLLSHFFLRLVALLGIVSLFMNGKKNVWSKLSVAGLIVSGFGLLPIAFLGVLPTMGSWRILGELAMRPIGEWSVPLGIAVSFFPLANIAPPFLASTLLGGHSKLKLLAGGLALGTASLCAQMAFSNDMTFFLGETLFRVWMVANTAASVYLARLLFDKK